MKNILILISFITLSYSYAVGQNDSSLVNIQHYLQELAQDEDFGLSICIAQNDEIIYQDAFGYANRAHKVPNSDSTVVNIASIGKMFTAVAILQLVESGQISLELPIGTYLPEFPNTYMQDSITTHQLLTHTSGLPLWFSDSFDHEPKFDYLTLTDYLPFYKTLKVNRDKIGKYNYSNVGFTTLGYIIEAVSGMSYPSYLKEHIFKPLGMNHTNIWRLTDIIPNAATGYTRPLNPDDSWKTNYHLNLSSGPAGGAYASTRDLVQFMVGLKNKQLIKAKYVDLMMSSQITTGYGAYGYGIAIEDYNGQTIIGHQGGYYGTRGELLWYKDKDYLISILANSDHTDYIDLRYFIRTELSETTKEKTAYHRTLQLLKSINLQENQFEAAQVEKWKQQDLDEALIQIKAYYYFNKQQYEQAKWLFQLNYLLFPNSESAKHDWERVK